MLHLNEAIKQELLAEIGMLKNKVTRLEQQWTNILPHTQPIHKTSRRRLIKQGLWASGSIIVVLGNAETGTGGVMYCNRPDCAAILFAAI